MSGDTLLLYGAPIWLRGFGEDEDFPVIGRGEPPAQQVRDFDLMRWAGANSFRTLRYGPETFSTFTWRSASEMPNGSLNLIAG